MQKINSIEMYVHNLPQSAHFYRSVYGFSVAAKMENESQTSLLLNQGDIKLILTTPSSPNNHIAQHINLHGDGIKDITFSTSDLDSDFQRYVSRGAVPIQEPYHVKEGDKHYQKACVKAFGDTTHSFVEQGEEHDCYFPGFHKLNNAAETPNLLHRLDHIAICVESDTLDKWTEHYQHIYNLKVIYEEIITSENCGMDSRALVSADGAVKLVFVCPLKGSKTSPIATFLNSYNGSGVQHLAFETKNIVDTVSRLRQQGAEFLSHPDAYYESLQQDLQIDHSVINELSKLSILVDKDETGYLYQIFSKHITSRPTLFLEVIERAGCEGFGSDNVKALFRALEPKQQTPSLA